jgi:hypothetical protein
MTVDHQKDGLVHAYQQSLQKFDKHTRSHGTLIEHEAKLPLWADGGDHVHGKSATGYRYNWSFSNRSPGRRLSSLLSCDSNIF